MNPKNTGGGGYSTTERGKEAGPVVEPGQRQFSPQLSQPDNPTTRQAPFGCGGVPWCVGSHKFWQVWLDSEQGCLWSDGAGWWCGWGGRFTKNPDTPLLTNPGAKTNQSFFENHFITSCHPPGGRTVTLDTPAKNDLKPKESTVSLKKK